MATTRIPLIPFLFSVAAVCMMEILIRVPLIGHPANALLFLGGVRLAETGAILFSVWRCQHRIFPFGLAPKTLRTGVIQGLIWSSGFGSIILIGFTVCFLLAMDPLAWVRMPLPAGGTELMAFYLVGGIIGPIAEEFFFRGLIFGFFRRWGFWPAMVISTGIFVAAHLSGTRIPVIQLAGGVVFAVAYEKTGSLVTPIFIHVLGNLSIFTLALVA